LTDFKGKSKKNGFTVYKSSTKSMSVSLVTGISSSSSGLITPGSPASSALEASTNNIASKSDQQLPHHPSPWLHSKDWNHTTVKNVSK